MTVLLWLRDCYLKEWDAKIIKADGKSIVLDATAFYAEGGGQPTDTGTITTDHDTFKVVHSKKIGDVVSHEVDKQGLNEGENVHCVIDWERRYRLMRSHTAAHILSNIVMEETGAEITGNQLQEDKSRIDYNTEIFDKDQMTEFETRTNEIIAKNLEVNLRFLPRAEAMKIPAVFKLQKAFSEAIQEIRVISVGDFDVQACGGAHVRNTSEIGPITIIKTENKGRNNRRMYFKL